MIVNVFVRACMCVCLYTHGLVLSQPRCVFCVRTDYVAVAGVDYFVSDDFEIQFLGMMIERNERMHACVLRCFVVVAYIDLSRVGVLSSLC